MPRLEQASNFKNFTYSIRGEPIQRKNIRTSLHRRKTNGGLSVIRDILGFTGQKLKQTWQSLDKLYNKINNTIKILKFELNKIKFKDMFQLNAHAAPSSPPQQPLPPIHLDWKQ